MKIVSIIIPAHNAAKYLAATLQSCRDQTLAPSEVIVVDDGSQDDTEAVCAGCDVQYRKITNGGVSRARNTGAAMARGERLLFLDADDILLPHALESLSRTLDSSDAGVAYGMVIERAKPPKQARLNGFDFAAGVPPLPAQHNFWRSAVITPGSAMVRAELHKQCGGFVTGYEPLEDRDYWIKCGLLAPMAYIDSIVLDKRWALASHGSQHAKRIFRGQRAQRDLREWCQNRGVDFSWVPEAREILRQALDEALWRREFGVLKPLRNEARRHGLRHWKSALTSALVKSGEPDWIGVEPQVLCVE